MAIESESENKYISVNEGSVIVITIDDVEKENITIPANWRYNVRVDGNLIKQ